MDSLRKVTGLVIAAMLITQPADAWNIGAKGRVTGPAIHTTYFITPNNGSFPVKAKAYMGFFANGKCQCNAWYDIGTDTLKTGNYVDIDGFAVKSIAGEGYNCMTIYYTYRQLVTETFQLINDGVNYVGTFPASANIMIL